MNEQGQSWPETILTLSVLIVIFSTLLPFGTKMTSQLHHKKLAMHAAETAYHAALAYEYDQLTSGVREIDGNLYTWSTEASEICISYLSAAEERIKCVGY